MRFRPLAPAVVAAAALLITTPMASAEVDLPHGFGDRTVIDGLYMPSTVSFAPDGSLYVAELTGRILRFSGVDDPDPVEVADLSTEVHASEAGTGLLGMALDPRFPRRPYLYVGYTFDAPIGGTAPVWHQALSGKDYCYAETGDPGIQLGCPVSSRVSRLTLGSDWRASGEDVLLEDWCQQFISHSIGTLEFDSGGDLLVSHGDGASFSKADVGDLGDPQNPCSDPPLEGGALRSQDMLTPDDPQTLNGTIIRVDPRTGEGVDGNPYSGDGNVARILAYGFRNPFRFAIQPESDNLWVGDVGWGSDEEIDRLKPGVGRDFGWPCYEGEHRSAYRTLGAPLCDQLYATPHSAAGPWFSYRHKGPVVSGDGCTSRTGAVSAIGFEHGRRFPRRYDGAMFFADYTRSCIWSFRSDAAGRPRPGTVSTFANGVSGPTQITFDHGRMYYPDVFGGKIQRISYRR